MLPAKRRADRDGNRSPLWRAREPNELPEEVRLPEVFRLVARPRLSSERPTRSASLSEPRSLRDGVDPHSGDVTESAAAPLAARVLALAQKRPE